MKFKTTTVRGHGRGKSLGFPTINMIIPTSLPLKLPQGVYAARTTINEQKYIGALYYGPATVFGQKEPSLELYLFDTAGFYIGNGEEIEVDVVKFIRPAKDFEFPELLVKQMEEDVATIRLITH